MSDRPEHFDVVISNFAKHHAFQAARSAAEHNVLQRFYTGVYYQPTKQPYALIERLFSTRQVGLTERLRTRCEPGVDSYVLSMPFLGLMPRLVSHLPVIGGHPLSVSVDLACADVFDHAVARAQTRTCDIFHGFESCTLHSFERAKNLNATLVLDQPAMHIDTMRRLAASECARLGVPLPADPPFFQKAIERKYRELEMADYIFVGSQLVMNTLTSNGIAGSKIFIIPYAVEPTGLFRQVKRPERSQFTILFVGPLTWYRGLPYLLDVFERLNLPNTRLVVIGREHPGWGQYFRARFATIPNILWLPGMPRSELAYWYGESDVMVFPSVVGGISMVVYEAMSTGLPAIVSDGELAIRDGIDGLVASPHDLDAIEMAIRRVYEDRSFRQKLGENASVRAQEFSWANYRRNVFSAYQEIMRRKAVHDVSQ